jgi:hypothetical protein
MCKDKRADPDIDCLECFAWEYLIKRLRAGEVTDPCPEWHKEGKTSEQ